MNTNDEKVAKPTFADTGVDQTLADALADKGITHPFPIQELTLPLALSGADIIGQARTGTGKTLAFGLPLLQRIDTNLKKTQALVIVPTRELCLQVAADLEVGAARGVTSIAVYGGVGFDEQIEALTNGVHVVVGTPGRTLDHLNRRNLDLSNVHVVVLDEADEMLDMGFLPDVERLLSTVPEDRQTLLFSATMPSVIVKLARRFMSKPTFMRADAELHETAPTVDQHFFLVHRMDKPRVLARIMQSEGRGGAFVFTRTKHMADRLVRELEDLNLSAIAVHGDLRQTTREKNLDRFRAGKADILVATEVAARGLDVDNVTHVVNYDCPDDEKMYLHRIGRTARAGSSGVAVTFAEFNEIDRLNVIRKAVGAESETVEVFSTSDTLTEMFELPEETPWDHLVRASKGSSSRGSSSNRGGSSRDGGSSRGRQGDGKGSDDGSRRSGRKASSDGRPKSRAGSDGNRTEGSRRPRRPEGDAPSDSRSSSRSGDSRSDSRSTETSSDSSSRSRGESRDGSRERSSSDGSASTRTRTRTRTRSTSSDSDSSRSSGSSRSGSGRSSDSTESSPAPRTRARAGSRRSGDGGSDSGGNRNGGNRKNDSGRGESGRSDARGGESGNRGNRGGRSSGGNRGGGQGSDENGGNRSRGNRSGGGRSGGRSQSNDSNGRSSGSGGGTRTRRGEEARGEGQPRHSRKVEVEHLP